MKTRKELGKRKFVPGVTLELFNKLLNIYKIQNDKLKKAQKKQIKERA